jgi:hypothetical protein
MAATQGILFLVTSNSNNKNGGKMLPNGGNSMRPKICLLVSALLLIAVVRFPVQAQSDEPKTVLVAIYNVAPGKHLDFLKWMAAREAIQAEAGVAPTQWYAHTSGASWDYIAIGPDLTPEMNKKIDELTKKKNLTIGMKASLEFRQFVSSHSDTVAIGPSSAADLVKAAEN